MSIYTEQELAPYDGFEIECSDNGARIDLGATLRELDAAGYDLPMYSCLDPRKVTWLSRMPEKDRDEGETYDGAWWTNGLGDNAFDDDDPLKPESC